MTCVMMVFCGCIEIPDQHLINYTLSVAQLRVQLEKMAQIVSKHQGPLVVCGDFNGVPETPAIERMRQYFDSAYRFVNKHEPEYTCPTSLPQSKRVHIRNFVMWLLQMRPNPNANWRGTLDYIFVDPRLQTLDCKVVLNIPASENPQIYPSDHLGLWAEIKVN